MNKTETGIAGKAAYAALALLVILVSMTMLGDHDLWWHLRLGRSVLESGIYWTDSFSYTFAGSPQFSSEWLADLVLYLFYSAGGPAGVNVFKIAMLAATLFFLFMAMRTRWKEDGAAGFYATVVTLVIVVFAIRFRLFIRPFLFSFVFFSLFIYIFSRFEREQKIRLLYILPVAELLWANTSKGAFYGTFLSLLFVVGYYINNRKEPKNHRVLAVLAAVFVASLISPSLFRLYTLPAGVLLANRAIEVVGEHQPLTAELLWGYGLRYTFAYQLLLAGSLACLIFMRGYRFVFHLLLFAAFFVQSTMMVRMIDFFSLASAVLVVKPVEKAIEFVLARVPAAVLGTILSVLIIAAAVATTALSPTYRFGYGVKPDLFPEEALAFMDKEGVAGPLFNSYAFGGYIIWRAPERKVFIDGRGIGALYPTEFYNEYFELLKESEKWKAAEERWGFTAALLDYDMRDPRYPSHLNDNPDWAVVYWDNHSVVYLKRTPENAATIAANEYLVTRPNFYNFEYLLPYMRTTPGKAVALIEREIGLNPANQEPRLAKAFILYGLKRYDEALVELEASLKLKPDLAFEHSAMALILEKRGETERARAETLKALEKDPYDPSARVLKERLGL